MNSISFSNKPERSVQEILTNANQGLKRYWRIALAPAIVLIGLVIVFNIHAKDFFTSDTLIFTQPQRIQSDLLKAPTEREMRTRLEQLVQEILSRPRLRAIIERFELYPKLRGPKGLDLAVRLMRRKIDINPERSPTGIDLLQTFRLSFTHGDAKTSYAVAKALGDLFIEESLIERRSEIQSTEEFIDAELREARRKLEKTEKNVQAFISENFRQLPEHLNAAIARLENLQAQLTTNGQLMTANTVRRQSLESEMAKARESSRGFVAPGETTSSDPAKALEQLKAALVVLQSKYSAQHPDVMKTKRRIKTLEAQLDGQATNKGPKGPRETNLVRSIRIQISEVDAQLAALRKENEALKKQIDQLRADIQTMPLKEQELLKIKRDYNNVKAEYERLLQAKGKASLQNSLVKSQKASQFRIIEPAELPVYPAGPNRKLILFGGLVGSLTLFGALIFVLNLVNGAFKDRKGLEGETGLPVLGMIPPMPTPDTVSNRKRLTAVSAFASVVSLAFGSAIIFLLF